MTSPLNSTIARQVGWTYRHKGWVNPPGNDGATWRRDPPDFENSVDAHLEWTVPKAKEMGYPWFQLDRSDVPWWASFSGREHMDIYQEADTAALAICEAWGKLMEEVRDYPDGFVDALKFDLAVREKPADE